MSLNTYPNNPFPPSTEQMHRGDNEELQAQIDAIKDGATIDSFGDVETALATKTDNAVIAPEFDAEAGIYSVGDLVMHEGKLYEFTSAHETAGDWNSEEVSEKTVADEIDSLKSGLIKKLNVYKVDTFGGDVTIDSSGVWACLLINVVATGEANMHIYNMVSQELSHIVWDNVARLTITHNQDNTVTFGQVAGVGGYLAVIPFS